MGSSSAYCTKKNSSSLQASSWSFLDSLSSFRWPLDIEDFISNVCARTTLKSLINNDFSETFFFLCTSLSRVTYLQVLQKKKNFNFNANFSSKIIPFEINFYHSMIISMKICSQLWQLAIIFFWMKKNLFFI
jgi:hypothetical protein